MLPVLTLAIGVHEAIPIVAIAMLFNTTSRIVAYRHLPLPQMGMRRRAFALAGAVQGSLSAIFGGAGSVGAHFFLSYGLVRNAFVGTVAAGTLIINVTKTAAYGGFSLVDRDVPLIGAGIGVMMAIGAYAEGLLVRRVPESAFVLIIEKVMVAASVLLLVRG